MTNRNELLNAFAAIMTLAGKIDANQQKVNMLHYMHGRADEAHHWQAFVDNQRVRIAGMRKAFAEMTASMTAEQVSAIKLEVFNTEMEKVGA
jgi:hypothetical protein